MKFLNQSNCVVALVISILHIPKYTDFSSWFAQAWCASTLVLVRLLWKKRSAQPVKGGMASSPSAMTSQVLPQARHSTQTSKVIARGEGALRAFTNDLVFVAHFTQSSWQMLRNLFPQRIR